MFPATRNRGVAMPKLPPRQKKSDKVEIETPKVHLHYASSISGLKGVADKNMILWATEFRVKYIKTYDGDTRIAIVSDSFDNEDKVSIFEGSLFIVTSPTLAREAGVHLLILPDDANTNANSGAITTDIKRRFNYNQVETALEMPGVKEKGWTAISIGKEYGENSDSMFVIHPPAAKCGVQVFTPSAQNYTPLPGMEDFLAEGVSNFFGELVTDTKHPAYKRCTEMR